MKSNKAELHKLIKEIGHQDAEKQKELLALKPTGKRAQRLLNALREQVRLGK